MKKTISILLLLTSLCSFGQNGTTFQIEELTKPARLLPVRSYDDICKKLIIEGSGLSEILDNQKQFDSDDGIVAFSQTPDSMVSFGYHSFFDGMFQAYADHRPFVLSPDMIWLLISQGFARHVNAKAEELRNCFVDFSGKKTLEVLTDRELFRNPSDWEKIFPEFLSQIAGYTGQELMNTLTSDFTTTTAVEKMASQITVMEAMKPYFEYKVIYTGCGIPELTLLGTPGDWQKVLEKTQKIGKYKLEWWTKELEPLLKQFVRASEGKVDKKFWRNMFKYHSKKRYGAPLIIDGWIVKFFPYDKYGVPNNLDKLEKANDLPNEIVKTELKYVKTDGPITDEIMLELWAGFIGLEQDPVNFTLTPKIGWLIRKKNDGKSGVNQQLEYRNVPGTMIDRGIDIRITEVPEELKTLGDIFSLRLRFKGKVHIPDWLKDIRIGRLEIDGPITKREEVEIAGYFPRTEVKINGEEYNKGKNGWFFVYDVIPESIRRISEIWLLEVSEYNNRGKIIIPDWIKEIKISNLSLNYSVSDENIARLKVLLPDTKIFIKGKRIE